MHGNKKFKRCGRCKTTLYCSTECGKAAWPRPVRKSNLQPDFNVSACDSFDASSSAVLRELDASNRFVQKLAESTSIWPS
jgi:hypothetical protein